MVAISGRFKAREAYYREKSIRPLTPSSAQLKALDEEVEAMMAKKKLIQDDFSEVDPYAEFAGWKKVLFKYFMLPQGAYRRDRS